MDGAIGVIDSGVGGLTVVKELMRQLPKEKLIYLGDTKRCPYGSRTDREIIQFTWEMVRFLLQKEIKALVVACNTATAFTLPALQKELSIPVIGVIQPGARAAIKATKNKNIGVIGTEGTIRSQAYEQALQDIQFDIQVNSLACPLFVPMVEKGVLAGKEAEQVVESSLQPLKNVNHIDTLILGCTHYPLIEDTIQRVLGDDVTIVSSSGETAREVSAILEMNGLLYKGDKRPKHVFYTTGNVNFFKEMSKVIFANNPSDLNNVTIDKVVISYES